MIPQCLAALAAACLLAACSADAGPQPPGGEIACTQEAKQCPDGSWVGRSGPRCEFACPQAPGR